MAQQRHDARAIRRRVGLEAGAWGILSTTNTAFVGPLLLSRGAGPLAFGVYNSAINLFGLGAACFGPRLARQAGGSSRATFVALAAARSIFIAVPLLLVLTAGGAVPALIAVLVLWAAGEGIALPLWTASVAGVAEPAERGRWLAARATIAVGAGVCVVVPTLVLLSLGPTGRALQVAYAGAAVAGLVGLLQVRALGGMLPPQAAPAPWGWRPPGELDPRFLGGVFLFWFGAALNRPVLPAYVVDHLRAPASYFAVAAVAAAVAGVVTQPWWGRYADARGARAVLGISGLGAGAAPLLWAVVPVYWLGLPVEALAAGCWLGHLLGLALRGVELADDAARRPAVLAWTQLAQGAGAALAPLLAAAVVRPVGTGPILVTSGALCLGATTMLAGEPSAMGRRAVPRLRGVLLMPARAVRPHAATGIERGGEMG